MAAAKRSVLRKSKSIAIAKGRRTQDEAKAEIVAVARDFLSTHEFHKLTVGALMQRTAIGRSAFYAYFTDVYELAAIFIEEVALGVEESIRGWLGDGSDPVKRVRVALKNAIAFWQSNGRLIQALEHAASQDRRLQRLWRAEVAMRPVVLVADTIRRDQASGLIGPMDADQISSALNRFNMTYLNDSFAIERPRDPAEVLKTLERVWLGTLYGEVSIAKLSKSHARLRASK